MKELVISKEQDKMSEKSRDYNPIIVDLNRRRWRGLHALFVIIDCNHVDFFSDN